MTHTRRAYARAAADFLARRAEVSVPGHAKRPYGGRDTKGRQLSGRLDVSGKLPLDGRFPACPPTRVDDGFPDKGQGRMAVKTGRLGLTAASAFAGGRHPGGLDAGLRGCGTDRGGQDRARRSAARLDKSSRLAGLERLFRSNSQRRPPAHAMPARRQACPKEGNAARRPSAPGGNAGFAKSSPIDLSRRPVAHPPARSGISRRRRRLPRGRNALRAAGAQRGRGR